MSSNSAPRTPHLILASASEWRANLLRQAGFDIEVIPTDLDEDVYHQQISDPETLVKTLAKKKMEVYFEKHPRGEGPPTPGVVLTADTVIFLNGHIIGKPKDRDDAKHIIQQISGHTHDVWTGVCIYPPNIIVAEKSSVTVRPMTDIDINSYLNTNEWVGKAGGYQIQKTLGNYITRIEGSYTNIIGLPIKSVINYFH